MRIGILEPKNFSQSVLVQLKNLGEVSIYHNSTKLEKFLSDVDILFVRLNYKIDENFLKLCKNLQIICSPTTGETHIDKKALEKRNIRLITLKKYTNKLTEIRSTPEHTIGLLLALFRNYKLAILSEQNMHWDRDKCIGREIYKSKIGIIGMGRVGAQVAAYLSVFGAKISYIDTDTARSELFKNKYRVAENMSKLINFSDAVILTASYAGSGPFLLDKNLLLEMKNKFLINTARGELIDQESLFDLLKIDHFAGVAVDVLSDENNTLCNDALYELSQKPNFIVTPHIAGATHCAMQKTEEIVYRILVNECL